MSTRGDEMVLRKSEFTLSEILGALEGLSQVAVDESAALAAECRSAAQTEAQAAADAAMQELLVRVPALGSDALLTCNACQHEC